jgi:hypothetical protein
MGRDLTTIILLCLLANSCFPSTAEAEKSSEIFRSQGRGAGPGIDIMQIPALGSGCGPKQKLPILGRNVLQMTFFVKMPAGLKWFFSYFMSNTPASGQGTRNVYAENPRNL